MVYNGHGEDVCLLVTNNFHMLKLYLNIKMTILKNNNKLKKSAIMFIVKIVFLDPENIILHTKIVRMEYILTKL